MKRRWKIVLIVLVAIPILVLIGDFTYSSIIASRIRSWEATLERNPDGVREGCEAFSAGEGNAAILMVHGINDSPACYRQLAPALAKRGYHCCAMRLPGFAESMEAYAAANRDQWLEAVAQEAARLRERHDRVVIAAHSLGGAISVRFTRENPDQVDALILLAPAIDVSSERSPLLSPESWHHIGDWLLRFTTITETPFGLDAKVATEESYPLRSPFCPRSMFAETFALIRENEGRENEIKTPVLMLLSPDDQVIDSQAAERFYEKLKVAQKSLHQIEDTGHALTIDHKWPELVEHIDAFLGEIDGNDSEPSEP